MSQHLNLAKAARLVGVPRGLLQRKIRSGELPSFDGSVTLEDLRRVFPQVDLDPDPEYQRVQDIKDRAFGKRVLERALPDKEVLAARLSSIGQELAEARAQIGMFRRTLQGLMERLQGNDERLACDLRGWLSHELEQTPEPEALVARDSTLRVLSPHVRLMPSSHEFFVEGNDSILEAALRAGIALDYGCSSGNCGDCRARLVSGQTRQIRHHDYVLSEAEKLAGTILLCSHTAVTDLELEAHVAASPGELPRQEIEAKLRQLSPLGEDMLLVHVQTPRTHRLRFLAGQKARLFVGSDEVLLPIASCPCDDRNLQFHLPAHLAGTWCGYPDCRPEQGSMVRVTGPEGVFVLDEESTRSVIFIALDDGFATIKSLVEHAMAVDNAEEYWLWWLAAPHPGHYMINACRAWDDALDNFHFQARYLDVDGGSAAAGQWQVFFEELTATHPSLGDHDVYCAGGGGFEGACRTWLLARGLPPNQWRGQED